MEEKNYYLKHFFPVISFWGILSGLFGCFFILTRANFESLDIVKIFFSSFLFYLLIATFFWFLFHGGAKLIRINLEHKDSYLINTYIVNEHIDPDISDQKLKELFYIFKKEPLITFKNIWIYDGVVTFSIILTMHFVGTSIYNLIVILIGAFIAITTHSLFSMFFAERSFVTDLSRECRKILEEREITPKEEIQLFTLRNRFNYFIILLFLIVVIVLSFIPQPNFFLLVIVLIGFIMTVIISRELFSSIYSVFQEIKDFADKLPQEKRTKYFTGSSYKEVLDLSKNLNKSAKEIYEIREKERKAGKELQERLDELDKWYRLTVGRELKMVELKKEIKRLKKEKEGKEK